LVLLVSSGSPSKPSPPRDCKAESVAWGMQL
jgi:hypothetical protein